MNTEFAQCVKKARAGDADAFAELYSSVYKDLYRIALVNLKNQHDASDVVSDTVLEAYQSISSLRNEKAFKAWITRILTVKIKNRQKEYIEQREFTEEPDENSAEQEQSSEIDFEKLELMDGFRQLSEEDRLVLSLNVVSGYKSDEIAGMCGGNANTIRSKAARAKEKLKRLLTEKI